MVDGSKVLRFVNEKSDSISTGHELVEHRPMHPSLDNLYLSESHAEQLPAMLMPEEVQTVARDEMYIFIDSKKLNRFSLL
jgi:hypothetical protein